MFVRLNGPASGKGAAGKWTDAATGEHGDLLDVIRESCGLVDFRDVVDEARRFLSLPRLEPSPTSAHLGISRRVRPAHREAARRLFAMSQPICGHDRRDVSCAGAASRLCTRPRACASIRAATTGPTSDAPTETWPALIAAVTDLDGNITGAHRTWLDPFTVAARRPSTRRDGPWVISSATASASAWRDDVMAAGEGIETMLSLRCALPALPMAAALSANHLAAMLFPPTLAPALHRPRRAMPRATLAAGSSDRARAVGRHRGDRRSRRGWATSTRICVSSASMHFAQLCASSSPRRTSPASCCRSTGRRGDEAP